MKPLIIFAMVVSLLAPSTLSAEPTHPNEVGLYTNDDGTGATGVQGLLGPVELYLVVTRPTDTDTGQPFDSINAFQCRLEFSTVDNLAFVGEVLPPNSVNFVPDNHFNDGYMEYFVGMVDDWPVTNDSVVLITFTFAQTAPGMVAVRLGPIQVYPPDIPGHMIISTSFGPIMPMYPISGSHDAPVFLFDGEAVGVENQLFGSFKALFR